MTQPAPHDIRSTVLRPVGQAFVTRKPRLGPALLVFALHLLILLLLLTAGSSSLTSISAGRSNGDSGIVNVSITAPAKPKPSPTPAPRHEAPPPHTKTTQEGTKPDNAISATGTGNGSQPSGASTPAEPSAPGGAIPSDIADAFERALLEHIEPYRRYPSDAMGASGTVELMFTMDREGVITGVWIRQSSGSAALDREAVATVLRAQPLPHIPPELPDPLNITLPVSFNPAR
ncbi:MAG TPA: energy transducer TonB [Rhizomicrobium sp.]|jgi:protein TonB